MIIIKISFRIEIWHPMIDRNFTINLNRDFADGGRVGCLCRILFSQLRQLIAYYFKLGSEIPIIQKSWKRWIQYTSAFGSHFTQLESLPTLAALDAVNSKVGPEFPYETVAIVYGRWVMFVGSVSQTLSTSPLQTKHKKRC